MIANSTRRWNGYVCPDCRFVFRVPRDHDGVGLVCPSCRRLLKLPAPGEVLPPLVMEQAAPRQAASPSPEESHEHPELVRRRRRVIAEGEDLSWEHRGSIEHDEGGAWLMGSIIGGAVLLSAGILFFFLRPSTADREAAAPPAVAVTEVPPTAAPAAPPVVQSAPDAISFLKEAEPIAKAFFEAKEISALLPLIRHPEVTESRIRGMWPDGKIQSVGLGAFAEDSSASFSGNTATVNVRTSDFKEQKLSFVKVGQSWKIDWESWVGWSELSWDRLLKEKPETPKRFRVKLVPSTYYNFGFTDESKWKAFALLSSDGDHQIFGYVERDSEADRKIQLQDAPSGRLMLLDLKFPAGGASRNQVVIDKVVAEGWLEPETADQP